MERSLTLQQVYTHKQTYTHPNTHFVRHFEFPLYARSTLTLSPQYYFLDLLGSWLVNWVHVTWFSSY